MPATIDDIKARLGCSRPTAYRILETLRHRLDAPIQKEGSTGGFYYAKESQAPRYELPGLWFSSEELQALAIFQQLLGTLEPGLLEEQLAPLHARIERLRYHRREARPSARIEQWLKTKKTVLLLGVWERLNNPGFHSLEFEGIRNEAGRNSDFLSVKTSVEKTPAIGPRVRDNRVTA